MLQWCPLMITVDAHWNCGLETKEKLIKINWVKKRKNFRNTDVMIQLNSCPKLANIKQVQAQASQMLFRENQRTLRPFGAFLLCLATYLHQKLLVNRWFQRRSRCPTQLPITEIPLQAPRRLRLWWVAPRLHRHMKVLLNYVRPEEHKYDLKRRASLSTEKHMMHLLNFWHLKLNY